MTAMELAALTRSVDGRLGRCANRAGVLDADVAQLVATDLPRTVILPAGSGVCGQPNSTALLALLLVRFGVPTLVHEDVDRGSFPADNAKPIASGSAARAGPVSTAEILSELGIDAASTVAEAQQGFARNHIAHVFIGVLAPGLAALMSCNSPRAARSSARTLAKRIDPFAESPTSTAGGP